MPSSPSSPPRSESSTARATPTVTPGTYAFEYHGAKITVRVLAPSSDPRLAEVERYRKAAKAKPDHYFIVDVDNSSGSRYIGVYGVIVADPRGDAVWEADIVSDALGYWEANRGGPRPPVNPPDAMSKVARHYYDQMLVQRGQKATVIFDAWTKASSGRPAKVIVATGPEFQTSIEATKVPDPIGQ